LEKAGKDLLVKNLDGILNGTAPRKPQEDGEYWKSPDWDVVKNIGKIYIPQELSTRIMATHFEGKPYPVVTIGERKFELREV
jgi:hypothetical protein